MKSLNTILFTDANLSDKIVVNEEPIQAFSSYQNTIRVIAPYNHEWIPFAIFQPNNDANNVGIPSQFLIMQPAGTTIHNGETYYNYEIDVPEAISGTIRGSRVELVVSFWAIQGDLIGVARYDETVGGYNDTTYIKAKLAEDYPDAVQDDIVRVFNTETDWQFTETSVGSGVFEWQDTEDLLLTNLQDNRSDLLSFALRKGKDTRKPTHVPNNTEQILTILNGKVNSSTLTENYYDQNETDGLLADKLNRSGTPGLTGNLDLQNNDIINTDKIDANDIELPGYTSVKDELTDLNNTKLDRDGNPGLIGTLQMNQNDIANAGDVTGNDFTINDITGVNATFDGVTTDDVTVDTHGSVVGKLSQLQAEKIDKVLQSYQNANLGNGNVNQQRFYIEENGVAKQVTLNELRTYIAGDFASFGFVIAADAGDGTPDVPLSERFANKIYLVLIDDPQTTEDNYGEYLWIDNEWEFIGTTNVDLTDYYTKTEVNNLLQADDIDYDDSNTDYGTVNVQATLEQAHKLIGNAGDTGKTYNVATNGTDYETVRYDTDAEGYNTTTYIANQLSGDYPSAVVGDIVFVGNTETEWVFNDSNVWVNTSTSNVGTRNNPFKTIKNATQVISNLNPVSGPFGPTQPYTSIQIASGDYYEQLPIIVPPNTAMMGEDLRTVRVYPTSGLSDDGVTPNNESTMFKMSSGTLAQNMALYGMTGWVKPNDLTDPESTTVKGVGFALNPASPIFGASPYILDCSAFFPQGVGAYVDGDVHVLPNGTVLGNRSMLYYAYTNINDEGVGFWADNGGVIESVSNFTYYAAYGYLATRGGYIRGLNGSNSWGDWALFASGFLPDETPITGTLKGTIVEYIDLAGAFNVGETLTGSTSGATATILDVQEGTQKIYIERTSTATFTDDEEITGPNGSATLVGNEVGQSGALLIVEGLTAEPEIRTSIQLSDDADSYVISSVSGTYVDTSSVLILQLAQEKINVSQPGATVTIRKRYSQIRVTGHDFLNVGTGGVASITIGGGTLINPGTPPVQSQQTGEFNTGRVFAVSTDQDGNFRVGKFFAIDQGTGRATLDASAFDLSGLTSLRLGSIGAQLGEAINEFSSDPTLSQNSNQKVPTQAAIKTYVDGLLALKANLDDDVEFLSAKVKKLIWDTVEPATGLVTGETAWDDDLGTLSTQLDDALLDHGLQLYEQVTNDTGAVLERGKAVYVSGGQEPSDKVFAEYANNTDELQARRTFGLVVNDIANNERGYIITNGLLKDFDTSAYEVGDCLYVTTNGDLTNVVPAAPAFKIRVGVVVRKHPSAGRILVNIRLVTKLTQASDVSGTYTEGDVLRNDGSTFVPFDLDTALSGKADLVDVGGGVLKVPAAQLPSYVDDVLEGYYNEAGDNLFYQDVGFTIPLYDDGVNEGEDGKIYVDVSTNKTYRWSGSAYVEIGSSLALGETEFTAYRGDRGKTAYDHSQVADGSNPHGTTFDNIASKPTTISGYGINDSYTITEIDNLLDGVELTIETTLNTSWTGSSAPYEKIKTVTGILATDNPIIDINLDSVPYADWEDTERSWALIKRAVTTEDTITFYASDIPSIALPIRIKIVR